VVDWINHLGGLKRPWTDYISLLVKRVESVNIEDGSMQV
jgi:hypothetical protein